MNFEIHGCSVFNVLYKEMAILVVYLMLVIHVI